MGMGGRGVGVNVDILLTRTSDLSPVRSNGSPPTYPYDCQERLHGPGGHLGQSIHERDYSLGSHSSDPEPYLGVCLTTILHQGNRIIIQDAVCCLSLAANIPFSVTNSSVEPVLKAYSSSIV